MFRKIKIELNVNSIMTYYNQIASGYEELHKEEQLKKIAIIKNKIKFQPSWRILDVGCGPYFGDFEGKVIGIDSSRELLKKAKKKIPVIQGKGEFLPFKENSFDVVVSLTALQNFDDIEKGIQEIRRVAKKIAVITVLKRSPKINMVEELLSKYFTKIERIEEEKDMLFFCQLHE